MLSVSNPKGKMFATKVPASGDIKQSFKSSSGAQLEIMGNVKSGQLDLINTAFGCVWHASK